MESAAHIIETFLCLMSSKAAETERPGRKFVCVFNQSEELKRKATPGQHSMTGEQH